MSKVQIKEKDPLESAKSQGQAQFDSIKEMVEALEKAKEGEEGADHCQASEDAEQTIHEDALSVQVRSGWYTPGAELRGSAGEDAIKPAEYEILLCTGGSACRIIGQLSEHGEPETARLEVQDWFQPWTEYRPYWNANEPHGSETAESIMLAYARCFYFGEG
jgi:hypothetical protein